MIKERLVSFDVGINHLAYAVLQKNGDDVKIKDLDLICIFDENKKHICEGTLKNNTACTKIGKYEHNGKLYCKVHSPKTAVETKRINTKTVSFSKLACRIAVALDALDFSKCTKIVIENQPSMASKRMQFVSHVLFYELCRKYLTVDGGKCASVSYAPRDKFAAYDGPKIDNGSIDTTGKTKSSIKNKEYRNRKSAVIQIANYFFDKYAEDEWKEYFNSSNHDKQDDLSDAYVQGITAILGAKSQGFDSYAVSTTGRPGRRPGPGRRFRKSAK
jgi:hypothetical protein